MNLRIHAEWLPQIIPEERVVYCEQRKVTGLRGAENASNKLFGIAWSSHMRGGGVEHNVCVREDADIAIQVSGNEC